MTMWIEWTIGTRFLREGRAQSTLILVGIAVGVAVIVFLTALITGLQRNIIQRTLGTQAHVKVQPIEESNHILPAAPGSVLLVLESKRAQRLRPINNWQQVRDVLDAMPGVKAVSPLISGPAFARRSATCASFRCRKTWWRACFASVQATPSSASSWRPTWACGWATSCGWTGARAGKAW
jgi:lipoprotein-releasing system permease protein